MPHLPFLAHALQALAISLLISTTSSQLVFKSLKQTHNDHNRHSFSVSISNVPDGLDVSLVTVLKVNTLFDSAQKVANSFSVTTISGQPLVVKGAGPPDLPGYQESDFLTIKADSTWKREFKLEDYLAADDIAKARAANGSVVLVSIPSEFEGVVGGLSVVGEPYITDQDLQSVVIGSNPSPLKVSLSK